MKTTDLLLLIGGLILGYSMVSKETRREPAGGSTGLPFLNINIPEAASPGSNMPDIINLSPQPAESARGLDIGSLLSAFANIFKAGKEDTDVTSPAPGERATGDVKWTDPLEWLQGGGFDYGDYSPIDLGIGSMSLWNRAKLGFGRTLENAIPGSVRDIIMNPQPAWYSETYKEEEEEAQSVFRRAGISEVSTPEDLNRLLIANPQLTANEPAFGSKEYWISQGIW